MNRYVVSLFFKMYNLCDVNWNWSLGAIRMLCALLHLVLYSVKYRLSYLLDLVSCRLPSELQEFNPDQMLWPRLEGPAKRLLPGDYLLHLILSSRSESTNLSKKFRWNNSVGMGRFWRAGLKGSRFTAGRGDKEENGDRDRRGEGVGIKKGGGGTTPNDNITSETLIFLLHLR